MLLIHRPAPEPAPRGAQRRPRGVDTQEDPNVEEDRVDSQGGAQALPSQDSSEEEEEYVAYAPDSAPPSPVQGAFLFHLNHFTTPSFFQMHKNLLCPLLRSRR